VREVRTWAGLEPEAPPHPRLSEEQVVALASHPLVEIGAHTRRHPCLAALDAEDQRGEVAGSREDLARLLGAPPAGFAYPFGTPGTDWDAATRAAVASAGFEWAVGGRGLAGAGTDPFALPRLLVPDCGGRAFGRWLARIGA
jgi:peptidoglycan/xylan/chitin deacetylase (PgdA/CDA1 family)